MSRTQETWPYCRLSVWLLASHLIDICLTALSAIRKFYLPGVVGICLLYIYRSRSSSERWILHETMNLRIWLEYEINKRVLIRETVLIYWKKTYKYTIQNKIHYMIMYNVKKKSLQLLGILAKASWGPIRIRVLFTTAFLQALSVISSNSY